MREDIKTAVELGNKCRVWFGESLPPEKKEEKKDEKRDELAVSAEDLTEVKEWLSDAHSIIDSFQNVQYLHISCIEYCVCVNVIRVNRRVSTTRRASTGPRGR